jgi:hypothetical protein
MIYDPLYEKHFFPLFFHFFLSKRAFLFLNDLKLYLDVDLFSYFGMSLFKLEIPVFQFGGRFWNILLMMSFHLFFPSLFVEDTGTGERDSLFSVDLNNLLSF